MLDVWKPTETGAAKIDERDERSNRLLINILKLVVEYQNSGVAEM